MHCWNSRPGSPWRYPGLWSGSPKCRQPMEYSAHLVQTNYWMTLYLASKDDDLFDDSGSLVLEELLNDVAADRAGTNDGEFGVSRHELVLSTMWGFWINSCFTLFYLSTF